MNDNHPDFSRHAVYGGTFDPPTLGHIDLILRSAKKFDKLTVGIGVNPNKCALFSIAQRVDFLEQSLKDYPNIVVDAYDGLLVDFCRRIKAHVIIRGLRAIADFECEFQLALVNRDLAPEIETLFMIASADKIFLSSSVVKEIAANGRDISPYVPSCVARALSPELMERF